MIKFIETVKELFLGSANKGVYSVAQDTLPNTSEKSLAWNEFAIAVKKKQLSSGKKNIDYYEWNRRALELQDKRDLENNIE